MQIRPFRKNDTPALIRLFQETVHTVCRKDYSQEQLNAWAPEQIDEESWISRLAKSFTVVAEHSQQLAGFANLKADGCIDMFYVAAGYQHRGVGNLLFRAIEEEAKKLGLKKLQGDISLTARSFFLSKGFVVEREYSKKVGAVSFPNAIMVKTLAGSPK